MMLKKIVKRLLLFASGLIGLLTFLLSLNSLTTRQQSYQENVVDQKSLNHVIDYKRLEKEFGRNKMFSKNFKNQELIALSHFPLLRNVRIQFLEQPARFPLQSHPVFWSLLLPFHERHYVIIISNKSLEDYQKILLDNIPLEGQIGVLGHELAHVSYYQKSNSLEIAAVGVRYLFSKSFRNTFERMTDRITIHYGLGYRLLAWRSYYEGLIKKGEIGKIDQKLYFEDRYLTGEEIKKELERQKKEAD
jgi:hypothetical protein